MSFASGSGTFTEFWGCPGVGLQYEVLYNPTHIKIVIYEDFASVEEEPVIGEDPVEPKGAEEPPAPLLPTQLRFTAHATRRGGIDFCFDLPQAAQIDLEVYDFQGRRAARHSSGSQAGTHSYHWDGATESGARAVSGVYFGRAVIATAEGTSEITQRVLLVR